VASALESLRDVLNAADSPGPKQLVALRMSMYDSQLLLQSRCGGLPEFKKAAGIEHFLFPTHLTPVKLEDLLPIHKPRTRSREVRT
jgi:hypothetical protein